ncbi:MAG: response regulator, partial [Pirellulales bacterium]
MKNVLRLAIVDPKDVTREALKTLLLGMDQVWLEAECSRYEFFTDVVSQTKPDIGVVSLDADPERGLELVAELHQSAPQCSILVLSSSTDGNLILRAMRSGAKEFLSQPVKLPDLVDALQRIGNRSVAVGESKPRSSTVIAVAGSTGGVGTTSLSVNLGCALAADESNSVVLVDLDLSLGDADVFLDTIPDYTLVDVAQNATRMDFTLLKRSLTKHSSGLFLLPRPVQLEDVGAIST